MTKYLFMTACALLTPSLVFAQDDDYGHMHGGWHMMNYGYGNLFMWILLIVGIVLVVYLITQLSKDKTNPQLGPHETALDILRKRYAHGEINKEEFERIKQDLKD